MNLISSTTIKNADEVHIADCLLASKFFFEKVEASVIYDLGSGNGCPGLILGILDNSRQYILIDRDLRKVEFLKTMIARLGLTHVRAEQMPIEDIPENSMECAISRAYASITKSLLATRRKFKDKGRYFHMKSSNWYVEVADMPPQLCVEWEASAVGNYSLPDSEVESSLVSLDRIK